MQLDNYLKDPDKFSLDYFKNKIKFDEGRIDLNDLWA